MGEHGETGVAERAPPKNWDQTAISTAHLVRHTFENIGLSWEDFAKSIGVGQNFLINVSRYKSKPSPYFRSKLLQFCQKMVVRDIHKFIMLGDEIKERPTMHNLALALGIDDDDINRTQRQFSGYYLQFRQNEDGNFVSTWLKLLEREDGIGILRFVSWRPVKDTHIVSAGYYFSSGVFLYLVSHAVSSTSVRYSVVSKDKGRDLCGVTSGVSQTNTIQATKCYMKFVAPIDSRNVNRRDYIESLKVFSGDKLMEAFPEAAERLLNASVIFLPSDPD